jgi:hypothetical protein
MSARKAAKPVAKPDNKPARRGKAASPAKPAARPAVVPTASAAGANGDASATATTLAAEIDLALAAGNTDLLSTEALQALMAAVCRSYSARIEAGGHSAPLADGSRVTSTDVMVTASGLLKSANLAVFELGMWQSWTGR